MSLLETLSKRRADVTAEMESVLGHYADADATPSEADQANLAELKANLSTIDNRIGELADFDAANAAHEARMNAHRVGTLAGTDPVGTLGQRYLASAEFAAYRANGVAPAFTTEFNTIKSIDAGDLPFGGTSQVADAPRPANLTPVVDSFGRVQVSTLNTWWWVWPEHAPAAGGPIAEGTAKPEATITPDIVTGTLKKWAHHIGVTEEALMDAPRIRSEIESDLVAGVRVKANQDAVAVLLAGDATYQDASVAAGGQLIASIRKGLAMLQDYGYNPTVCYINPLDYADLDMLLLERTLNGAVALTSPWGLRYIPTSGVAAGKAYVADSAAAFQFQDRGQLSLKMTDSHASEFTSNVYRILAEAYGLSVLRRPAAVAACSVDAAARASK